VYDVKHISIPWTVQAVLSFYFANVVSERWRFYESQGKIRVLESNAARASVLLLYALCDKDAISRSIDLFLYILCSCSSSQLLTSHSVQSAKTEGCTKTDYKAARKDINKLVVIMLVCGLFVKCVITHLYRRVR